MLSLEKIQALVGQAFPKLSLKEVPNSTPPTLEISASGLAEVCRHLKAHPDTYFDFLSSITGIDNGEKEGSFEVIYHLYSIPYNYSLGLKVIVPRNEPIVPSLYEVWGAANWHEREAYDLLGIQFDGHPDLRRILLPDDWEGHPLRKDYEANGKYHGLPLQYAEARDGKSEHEG